MDPRTLAALEFDSLKELIRPSLRTASGGRALTALAPGSRPDRIARKKGLAAEAMQHHLEGGRLGPGALEDPEPILRRLRPEGAVLEGAEVSRLLGAMQAAGAIRSDLSALSERFPELARLGSTLPDLSGLVRAIAGRVAPDGALEDSASPELARIRKAILDQEARLQRALQTVLEEAGRLGLLQDSYVTVRGGRFVLPVRAEARGGLSGVVHGASSTGATLFVEPLATLELNNDLVTLRDEEASESRRILAAWSDLLRSRQAEISQAGELLGEIDLLGAIAVFGVAHGARLAADPAPSDPRLLLLEARHPGLEAGLKARGGEPVPLSVEMPSAGGALVLSGPNAGGKTVAMKTVGLLALMNQAGLPVPARDAVLPIFSQVLADIGDHQSILESLSTFSARMVRVAEMSQAIEGPSLVLLDEVGAGTDPEEAGPLAVAIVEHFRARGAAVVATTHHEALKLYAESTPGAVNASMEIDPSTMRPTYRLRPGSAGRSGGIDLAERLGLPADVVASARARVSGEHRDVSTYRSRLERLVEERDRELERIRGERIELEAERLRQREAAREEALRLQATWRDAVERALEAIEKARDEMIAGLRDRSVALQVRAEARRQSRTLREQLEASLLQPAGAGPGPAEPKPPDARRLAPGARVRLGGLHGGETGVIESIGSKGRLQVLVRGKRLTVDGRDATLIEEPGSPPAGPAPRLPAGVRLQRESRQEVGAEIHLIGARVEEAIDRLDKFLDDAFVAGHREVRIVHGHGTGRLRAAIRTFLREHPHVESARQADERAGGDGATVAVLRS